MVVTMQQVLDYLGSYEPDYEEAAKLGPEALPHLDQLLNSTDFLLAAKAISLAAMIDDKMSISIIQKASRSRNPIIRATAAANMRKLPISEMNELVSEFLKDRDPGIRKLALKSITRTVELEPERIDIHSPILDNIRNISGSDTSVVNRKLAKSILDRLTR